MAKRAEKTQAIEMRLAGKSYSEIRSVLGVSKSSLSLWLREYPLSEEQIRELRDLNPRRIENYKRTCQLRREKKLEEAYKRAKDDIGNLTAREMFVAGMFLYWAEGVKSYNAGTILSNSDPAMIKFFIRWLECMGVDKSRLRVRLQLYADMDPKKEIQYWSRELGISTSQFRTPAIKTSRLADVTYRKGGFGHGTCDIIFGNREMNDYVLQGMKYLRYLVE